MRVELDSKIGKLSEGQEKAIGMELRNRVQLALEDNTEVMQELTVGHICTFRVENPTISK